MTGAESSADRIARSVPFPRSLPPELNYVVLTGTLVGSPKEHRGPAGEPGVLLKIEFSVPSPINPSLLWTHASFEVEVPEDVGQHVEELRDGSSVMVSGQLSERLAIESGDTSRRGVILATLVVPDLPPEQSEESRC